MKTSTILLTVLLSLTMLFVVGANLVLKSEFDKIDQTDAFYGYKKEAVKPFKFVKIQGKQLGSTQIQQGEQFEILFKADRKLMNWKVDADTLELTYNRPWEEDPRAYDDFNTKPAVYIIAPKLSGITSLKTTSIVKGWTSKDLVIRQEGSAVLLTENHIENLYSQLASGGYMKINGTNAIGISNTEVKDSSSLSADKDIFRSFKANVDSLGHIKLPGGLYRKMMKI